MSIMVYFAVVFSIAACIQISTGASLIPTNQEIHAVPLQYELSDKAAAKNSEARATKIHEVPLLMSDIYQLDEAAFIEKQLNDGLMQTNFLPSAPELFQIATNDKTRESQSKFLVVVANDNKITESLSEPAEMSDADLMRLILASEKINNKEYKSDRSGNFITQPFQLRSGTIRDDDDEVQMRTLPTSPWMDLLTKVTHFVSKVVDFIARYTNPETYKAILLNKFGLRSILAKSKIWFRQIEVKLIKYKPFVLKHGKPLKPYLNFARNVVAVNLRNLLDYLSGYTLIKFNPAAFMPIMTIFSISVAVDVILYAGLMVIDTPPDWLYDVFIYALGGIWSVVSKLFPL